MAPKKCLFTSQKPAVNVHLKYLKLICNRILPTKTPGQTAQLVSEVSETERPVTQVKETVVRDLDVILMSVNIPVSRNNVLEVLNLSATGNMISKPS